MEITFENATPVSKMPVEFVERKGKGHPDTISDRSSEELSISLCEYYLSKFGRIYHHNVDKCVLVGGQAKAWFGGGKVIEPIYLLLVGRAAETIDGRKAPIKELAQESTKSWMQKELHYFNVDKDIKIATKIRPGSVDLVRNYDLADEIPLANDTSFGVWYGPNTEVENAVFNVERELNSFETKKKYPQIGEDVKVMGVRRGNELYLTIACAVVSHFVKDKRQYAEAKQIIHDLALKTARKCSKLPITIKVNTADNPEKDLYYLTVTGTSAEHGDDGQVGRGNRANGLITPFRPMTLEATAGKNPISHTGKIYNIAAKKIVDQILKDYPDIEQTSCYIVSEIGKPINLPQAINVEVHSKYSKKFENEIKSIVDEKIQGMPVYWKEIVKREHQLF
ncbi:MAG TPA: methionine adenosyltransferase [Nitrososphaerales archaeon]|nr:methionine adenosyltransferase [Nitrososphaerales archaeon]